MEVKAGGNATTVEQPKSQPGGDRRNASELDAWLEKAEAMGELKRITAGPSLYRPRNPRRNSSCIRSSLAFSFSGVRA